MHCDICQRWFLQIVERQVVMSVQFEDAQFCSIILAHGIDREDEVSNQHSEDPKIDEGLQEENQRGK